MGKHRCILLNITLSVLTCALSAEESVSLRRITGAELKYLYEFPTLRAIDDKTDEGIDEKFERCPGLSFIIVDNATSKALTNGFMTDKALARDVASDAIIINDNICSINREIYDALRYVLRREDSNGSMVNAKKPDEIPFSILYISDPKVENYTIRDMLSVYTSNAQFSNGVEAGDKSSHPWICSEDEDSYNFKMYMKPNTNQYFVRYNSSNDMFRLYTSQVDYNLNLYQLENIFIAGEPNTDGGVEVKISHMDEDPVMQKAGEIEMCVVVNNGTKVSPTDMMESTMRYSLYSKDDNSWKSSLSIEGKSVSTISRTDESAPTTVWLQPCYTLTYNDEKHSVPVGRITSVAIKDSSSAKVEIGADRIEDQTPIYYNLQGQRIVSPVQGSLYIRVTPTSATKIRY